MWDSCCLDWQPIYNPGGSQLDAVLCAVLSHIRKEWWFACVCACVPTLRLSIFPERVPFPASKWNILAEAQIFWVLNAQQSLPRTSGHFSVLGERPLVGQAFKDVRPSQHSSWGCLCWVSESCGTECRISVPFGYLCTLDNNDCQANVSQVF